MASWTSRPRPNCAARSSERSTSTPAARWSSTSRASTSSTRPASGVLAGGLTRARDRQGDVMMVATGQNVIRVLELTGLTRAFEIHPSRAAALSAGK